MTSTGNLEKALLLDISRYEKSKSKLCRVAKHFYDLVHFQINDILSKNREVELKIGDTNVIYPNSPILSSTGIGYLVEAKIYSLLKSKNIVSEKNTNQSFYDLKYDYSKNVELFVNIKVQKRNNPGICASGKYLKYYIKTPKVTKLYLVYVINYSLDEDRGKLVFGNSSGYFVESFITKVFKCDKRNWSKKFNPFSGRIQKPKSIGLIEDIPEWNIIIKCLNKLYTQ